MIDKRQKNEKHFRLEDNKFRAILYPNQVHYLDNDGNWQEINNTLSKDTSQNEDEYSNVKNNLKVSYKEKTNKNSYIMNLILDKYEIDLYINDIMNDVDAIIENPNPETSDEILMPRIKNKVSYLNIYNQHDLTFDLISQSVDCIIKNNSISGIEPISFNLKLKNLNLKQEENRILLVDKDDETKTIFELDKNFIINHDYFESREKCEMEIETEDTLVDAENPESDTENSDTEISSVLLTLKPELTENNEETLDYKIASETGDDSLVILTIAAVQNIALWDSVITYYNPNGNYSSSQYLGVGLNPNGLERSFVKIPTLPTLHSGDMVTSAKYHLTSYVYAGNNQVNLCEATVNWNPSTITWNNQPPHSSVIRDFKVIDSTNTTYDYDITFLTKNWYNYPSTNYGFVLMNNNETYAYNVFYSSKNSINQPYVTIDYINCTGLDSMWTYHTMNAAIAGTVNIHDYTGNACLVVDDVVLAGNLMPVNLQHVYNSNDKDVDFGYGLGFRLSYMQTVVSEISSNGMINYVYTDGTGRNHYYADYENIGTYINNFDSDTKLTIDSNNLITITDKANNRIKFDSLGRLNSMIDSNNNQLQVVYNPSGLISTITDGANRVTQLIYSSNYLTSILKPNGLSIYFNYQTAGSIRKLTSITYQNDPQNAAYYGYNVNNLLISAKTMTGYTVNLEYNAVAPFRVTRFYENNTTVVPNLQGNDVTINYGYNTNIYIDQNYRLTIFQFNNFGQTISNRTSDNSSYYQEYDSERQKLSKISSNSKTQRSVVNLIPNPLAERNTDWNYQYWGNSTQGSGYYSTDFAYIGSRSLKLTSNNNAANVNWNQNLSLTPGKTYTLSAYAKCNTWNSTSHAYADVYLEFVYTMNGTTYNNGPLSNKISGNTDWTRLKVTFTVPSNTIGVTIRCRLVFTVGTAWFDAIQLEEGYGVSPFNLVENCDFTNSLTNWDTNSGVIVSINPLDPYFPSFLSPQCVQLSGVYNQRKYVYQYITARGSAGDEFIYSAWAKASSIPQDGDNGQYRMIIGYQGLSGVYSYEYTEFNHDPEVWQYLCAQSKAPFDYQNLVVGFEYNNNANTAYVDCIELYRDVLNTNYTYDVDGNLTQSSDIQNSVTSYDYSSRNDVVVQRDAKNYEMNLTYDANHNLLTTNSGADIKNTNSYDVKGNKTNAIIGTGNFISTTQYQYEPTGSFANRITDSRGYFAQYNYNVSSGDLNQFIDARGNGTNYYYNSSNFNQLSSVENFLASANMHLYSYYYYEDNKLSRINCAGFNYILNYDGLGNLSSVVVESSNLAKYNLANYTYDLGKGLLSNIQYANGQSVYYSYDIFSDRLLLTMTNIGNVFRFSYDNVGNLVRIEDQDKGIISNITYDSLGRPIGVLRSDSIGYNYSYDINGNLTENIDSISGITKNTSYQYDGDNRLFKLTLDNGMGYYYNYNSMGLVCNISCEIPSLNVSIKYLDGINGNKTSFISSYARCSDAYLYEYDANGNITRTTYGIYSVKYTYNEINVLTREDNGFINKSYVYSYDMGGNMTQRQTYAYTEGTLTTLLSTDTFGYDVVWTDKLSSYNGTSIISDQVGNPTSYMGYTLTWFGGRRLKQLTGNGKTVVYEYNEDNIRITKTVNGVTTTFYWNNNKIVAQKTGNNTFYYSYDSMGKVIGMLYNNNMYYYIYNGQNDVVGLADSNGNTVVSYIYDAWGNIFSVTGTMAATLGVDNPFRYRGYFYDEETKFYYLQSRYYDPNICRFINADEFTMLYNAPGNVLGANMFIYCMNNPVMNSDLTGHLPWYQHLNSALRVISTIEFVIKGLSRGLNTQALYYTLLTNLVALKVSVILARIVAAGISLAILIGSTYAALKFINSLSSYINELSYHVKRIIPGHRD